MTPVAVGPEALVGVAIGLGLAAAAGFRVFVPLLAAAIAAKVGVLTLSPGFAWLASTPALAALGTATVLEVGAYAIPWLDQLLDVLATPAAMAAGMLAAASVVVELPPVLKWGAVLLAGGAAGITQGATVLTRFKSTTLTGGAGNPFVSMLELVGAVVTSVFAIFLPIVTLVAVGLMLVWVSRRLQGIVFGRRGAKLRVIGDDDEDLAVGGRPRVPRGP
jgi:hypothetical protein